MGTTVMSARAYLETGLDVLAELGFGGLKLAELCNRLGVTTGSFYHYFPRWPAYTRRLAWHWFEVRAAPAMESVRAEADPRRRIDRLIRVLSAPPRGVEAAIRSWSSVDSDVHAVQTRVDRLRFDILHDSARQELDDEHSARVFADCVMYLIIGYEQTPLPRDSAALTFTTRLLLDALNSGPDSGSIAASADTGPGDRRFELRGSPR